MIHWVCIINVCVELTNKPIVFSVWNIKEKHVGIYNKQL